MEVSIVDTSDVEKNLNVTLTFEEAAPHFEKAYKKQQAKIEIKGFRKGKAPLSLIKKMYGTAIEYDSLDDIANELFNQIIKEKNIKPIGEPTLSDVKYEPNSPLSFTVKYEIAPQIELKDYKGIEVEKPVHTIDEEEIDDEILRIRNSNSTLEEVQTATDDEHIITIDVQELDDSGTPLIGKRNTGSRVYLADENVYPEVRNALAEVSLGDKRMVSFEVEHGDHKHLNNWEMHVTKIEKVVLPDLTDEFVKKATKLKVSTVEEFKDNVKKDLENYWRDFGDREMKNALIGEVVKRHDFTVPEALIKGLTESQVEEFKNQSPAKKLPDDFDMEKFRAGYRPSAIFQAKWFLIRDRIIEKENLAITDAELEQRAEEDSPKMNISKERLLSFYKTSGSITERMEYEKVMNLLISSAVITEKPYNEEPENMLMP